MKIDIENLRRWNGREQTDSELLTPMLVRQFNATFDRVSDVEEGSPAPLLIHFCLAQPVVPGAQLGPDGHSARGDFLPPVPLPRRMWAGGAIRFHSDIRIGETLSRRSTIRDVEVKQGRTGTLCFVTVEHEIASNGRVALSERQDIVYRDDPTPRPVSIEPPPLAKQGSNSRQIDSTAPLLFRYSAMTFNAHRIHYDKPYANEIEGYPGLVVHGPMQATLLCQMAADLRQASPLRFRFRSLSPVFDDAPFTINAEDDGREVKLWTARPGGPVAMEALAQW